jgi:hypothetical protein
MKFRIQQIKDAIDFFRYESGCPDTEVVEVSILEEDIQEGSIMGTMSLTIESTKSVEKWSRYCGEKKIKYCLEIFPAHENRNPILTTEETQELVLKD